MARKKEPRIVEESRKQSDGRLINPSDKRIQKRKLDQSLKILRGK